jgi:hypothetical protein
VFQEKEALLSGFEKTGKFGGSRALPLFLDLLLNVFLSYFLLDSSAHLETISSSSWYWLVFLSLIPDVLTALLVRQFNSLLVSLLILF